MNIKTVAVVGANGTMGANVSAIFASFGNAKVFMISRNIDSSKKAIEKAVKSVRADSIRDNLVPADYSMLDDCVKESELVFECVVENMDIKIDITKRIASSLRESSILCSGTSGLSITKLAECLPESLRDCYYGVHMFNPPYSMTLCELITTSYTKEDNKKDFIEYLKNTLFRSVIEVKDEPAFLANRIGFQFINEAIQFAERYKDSGGIDYIDAILGCFTGRSMPPLVTADFVGLDVHKAIVENIYSKTKDYLHKTFRLPDFVQDLIDSGKLGKKSGEGFYKTELDCDGRKIEKVFDLNTKEYRLKNKYSFPFAEGMKEYIRIGDYSKAIECLINNHSQEAEICLHFLLSYILYSLKTAKNVAYDFSDADVAMAAGFNWCPPLAMIEMISLSCDVKSLIVNRFDKNYLECLNIEDLFSQVNKSKYDYRPFFKSEKRG